MNYKVQTGKYKYGSASHSDYTSESITRHGLQTRASKCILEDERQLASIACAKQQEAGAKKRNKRTLAPEKYKV
ncbi:hypothetical protein [Pontibacter kalidii]|uniref:hypothetical protein n=1 Tax=Pontibacter kalidii TaxID=2592049 RepID=UPI002257F6DD|nr:hypothetical protein [Pontibacter kalidii]